MAGTGSYRKRCSDYSTLALLTTWYSTHEKELVLFHYYSKLCRMLIGERASHSSMKNAIRNTYIYRYVRHTLVAQSWGYVMWEELRVSHF